MIKGLRKVLLPLLEGLSLKKLTLQKTVPQKLCSDSRKLALFNFQIFEQISNFKATLGGFSCPFFFGKLALFRIKVVRKFDKNIPKRIFQQPENWGLVLNFPNLLSKKLLDTLNVELKASEKYAIRFHLRHHSQELTD